MSTAPMDMALLLTSAARLISQSIFLAARPHAWGPRRLHSAIGPPPTWVLAGALLRHSRLSPCLSLPPLNQSSGKPSLLNLCQLPKCLAFLMGLQSLFSFSTGLWAGSSLAFAVKPFLKLSISASFQWFIGVASSACGISELQGLLAGSAAQSCLPCIQLSICNQVHFLAQLQSIADHRGRPACALLAFASSMS